MRAPYRFLLPDGLLVGAGLVVTQVPSFRSAVAGVAPTVFAAALAAGALLSLRFRRGRVLLLLVMLAVTDRVLALWAPLLGPSERACFALNAALLPLNMAVIALLPERGALTPAGLVRLAGLGVELAAAGALLAWAGAAVGAVLEASLIPAELVSWTVVPQPALALAVVAALLFVVVWIREHSPLARGLFWSLVAALLGLHAHGPGGAASTWFAVAAIVLTLAVVESSYALAYHDPLTGLPGRRALAEALHEPGSHYTVAVVDVDHFKQCNDRWGHDVGDQVLKMVASRLHSVGGAGRAFRYGGEEFVVLFPGLEAAAARLYLELLRAAVEGSSFSVRLRPRPHKKPARRKAARRKTEQVAVTISIGLAQGNGRSLPDAVIEEADRALYRAKENGRNRVEG